MSSTKLKPKWWQLYLTFPLLIFLFVMDARLKMSMRGHEAVQIGIIVLVYGLIHLWIKSNRSALTHSYTREDYGRVTIIQIPPFRLSTSDEPKLTSEIHGVLGDTFEMDVIDAKLLPVDEVPEKISQE